ncbi:uncharacterized protein RJT20DRAFT_135899 [Scheffersomyces xylosifermentans]|uniref:uncharacterized protein n=1 Tax=Scheffersomyces xylosifermentans TaxID=1304137 RepID=UPI00315C88E5
MSSTTTKVFLTGATGYIGGQVAYELVNSKEHKFVVTALVRSQQKAEKLKAASDNKIIPVIGTLDDLTLLGKQVEENDVIINTANVDHVPSAQALSDALSEAKEKKILIHTSGTSVLGDGLDAKKGATTKVYSDKYDIDEINSLDLEQPHRPVDKIILDIHDRNPKVEVAIICPSTIYGISNGYDNVVSAQIPWLIKSTIRHNKGYSVFDGNYVWNHIHIKDLGDLYLLLLNKLLRGDDVPANRQGYYFGSYAIEGEEKVTTEPSEIEHTWRQVSAAVAESLFAKGVIESKEVDSLQPEPIIKLNDSEWAPYYWGTNSRSRGDNGYAIGWKPKHISNKEFFESIDADVDYQLKHSKT